MKEKTLILVMTQKIEKGGGKSTRYELVGDKSLENDLLEYFITDMLKRFRFFSLKR